jgi:hypothetical protein
MCPACRVAASWRCVPYVTAKTALFSHPNRATAGGFPVNNYSSNFPAAHGRWRRRLAIDYDLSERSSRHGSALTIGTETHSCKACSLDSRTERSRGERRLAGGAGIRIAASACCASTTSCQLARRDAAEICAGDRGVDRADPGSLEGAACRSQETEADDDVRGFLDSRYGPVP